MESLAIEVLKQLEWSAVYSYCTGWPCCPVCRGIKPGYGRDEDGSLPMNTNHTADCKLGKAIKNES